MKKTLYIICLVVLTALSVGYGISFHALSGKYEKMKAEQEALLAEPVQQADSSRERIVSADMYCVEETVNLATGEITQEERTVKDSWVGLNRIELIRSLRDYAASPSREDRSLGLCGYELVAFSDDALVVRKEIQPGSEKSYEYFMILEEGHVIVYYADQKTVYMDTHITEEELRAEDIESLKAGLYLESIWDVYHFLESYTS